MFGLNGNNRLGQSGQKARPNHANRSCVRSAHVACDTISITMNTNVSSFLSATSNFSSIAFKSMLGFPARFFGHMRRVDDVFVMDIQSTQTGGQPQPSYSNIPGPWAFITSGYAVSLVVMVGNCVFLFLSLRCPFRV